MYSNEEEYIRTRAGVENPFTVPEGYFEQLPSRIMQSLPAGQQPGEARKERKPALLFSLRPLLYAAACLAIVVMSVVAYFHDDSAEGSQAVAAAQDAAIDTYIDDVTDYSMLDNYDIYACLTSE